MDTCLWFKKLGVVLKVIKAWRENNNVDRVGTKAKEGDDNCGG